MKLRLFFLILSGIALVTLLVLGFLREGEGSHSLNVVSSPRDSADGTRRTVGETAKEDYHKNNRLPSEQSERAGIGKELEHNDAGEILRHLGVDPSVLTEVVDVHDDRRQSVTGVAFEFGRHGFIEFNKSMTRVITYYRDELDDDGQILCESEVEEIWMRALEKCGIGVQEGGAKLYIGDGINLSKTPGNRWQALAEYRFGGVRSMCGVLMTIGPEGNVESIKARPIIPPMDLVPKLTEQEAHSIAETYCRKNLSMPGKVKSVDELAVVRAAARFVDLPASLRTSEETYLAWTIDFQYGPAQSTLIYVDAINGKIIGGLM